VSIFEAVRDQVPVDSLLETNSGGKDHCVAQEHEDANPSMHVYGDHVHCFACRFHGDVVDVHAALRGFDSAFEATLDLAREFGVDLPQRDPQAQKKAQERREKRAGMSSRPKHATAPSTDTQGWPHGGMGGALARSSENGSC
jgi:DNA primase